MNQLTAEAVAPHQRDDLSVFNGVEAWIFDLDNTLYPRSSNLFAQIDANIRAYVARLLNIGEVEAERLQKSFYREHGTTLRGLMMEHEIDPDDFLQFVHNIDHTVLKPDPALGAAILRLPGKKYIFTNGSRAHAERVAARLGFSEHFEDIFDIVGAKLVPKPERETYDRFIAQFGMRTEHAAMFEDLSRNLIVPKAVGMRTVLVVPPGIRDVFHDEWELEGRNDAHVDFVTDDLAVFLGRVADVVT